MSYNDEINSSDIDFLIKDFKIVLALADSLIDTVYWKIFEGSNVRNVSLSFVFNGKIFVLFFWAVEVCFLDSNDKVGQKHVACLLY